MKCWEIIADNLSKAGWSCGCISSTDHNDNFGLWPQSVRTRDALLCTRMNCWPRLWNSNR